MPAHCQPPPPDAGAARDQRAKPAAPASPYFALIDDMVHDVVFALAVEAGEQYRFIHVNRGFERATGLAADAVIGRLVDQVIPPQSLPMVKEKYGAALRSGAAVHWDELSVYPSGTKVGEVTVRAADDPTSGRTILVGTVHDVTERHTAQARLAELEERWRLALEASGAAAWDWNSQTNYVRFSQQWRELLGRDPAPLAADQASLGTLVHPDDMGQVGATWRAIVHGNLRRFMLELRLRHADGHWTWVRCGGRAYREGKDEVRVLGTLVDISAPKEAERLLWHQAHHDGLTGLPNRYLFLERMHAAVADGRGAAVHCAVLLIDLDDFKEVNDAAGHAAGDRLLRQAGERIVACVAPRVTVARLGGDEFTVLMRLPSAARHDEREQVDTAAAAILRALARPFEIDGHVLHSCASIGIARTPDDGDGADLLLKHAYQALHEAKRQGGNRAEWFRMSLQEQVRHRRAMLADLRVAVANGELEVVYQPIIDFATGRICKAEALLRWNHPARGTIGPVEFIPLCEETGLIIEIGEWVFAAVIAQTARWHRRGWHDLKVGLNVSPVQIRHGDDSCARCLALLAAEHLPAGTIVVEVTEGSLLQNDGVVQGQLRHMQEHGIALALDDFGTGYSALSYLLEYTFAFLKIDRAFVHQMDTCGNKRALCDAIIMMSHRLGIKVIAEGIENERDAQRLRIAGCDFGQGFYFSPPVSARELEAQLAGIVHNASLHNEPPWLAPPPGSDPPHQVH